MAVTDVFGVAILLFRAVVAEATLLFDTSSSYRTIHNMVYTNLIWKRLNFNIFIIMKSLFFRKWGLYIQLNSNLDKHFKIWFFMLDVWDLYKVHFFWIRLYSRIMTSWNVQLSCLNSANLIITLTAIVLLYQLFHS